MTQEEKLNKIYRVKHVILLQIVRDTLIKNGLTTREDFNEEFSLKVEQMVNDEEMKKELLNHV